MATSRSVGGPVYDVLDECLPKGTMRKRGPFDVRGVVDSMSNSALENLILALDQLSWQVQRPLKEDDTWRLPSLLTGELPAYVTPGTDLNRRLCHAGLFADRIFTPPPTLPQWALGVTNYDAAQLIRRRRKGDAAPRVTSQPARRLPPPEPAEMGDLFDEIDQILELDVEEERRDFERLQPHLQEQLKPIAEALVSYWWHIGDAIAEGWLYVANPVPLHTDNIRGMAEDSDFRAELEPLIERHKNNPPWKTEMLPTSRWHQLGSHTLESWRELFTTAALANNLGRSHVVTIPADPFTRDLIALTSRYFAEIPHGGGAMIGLPQPTRRVRVAGGGDIERGAWFDEVMLGLGPAVDMLDLHTVRELRHSGTAAALRHWITTDLDKIAFATYRGEHPEGALAEARHQLSRIADAAGAQVNRTGSELTRRRLVSAGLWGAAGGASMFVGTVITGGALPLAVVLAGIGFGLNAAAGGMTVGADQRAIPDPVIYDLVSRLRNQRRQP